MACVSGEWSRAGAGVNLYIRASSTRPCAGTAKILTLVALLPGIIALWFQIIDDKGGNTDTTVHSLLMGNNRKGKSSDNIEVASCGSVIERYACVVPDMTCLDFPASQRPLQSLPHTPSFYCKKLLNPHPTLQCYRCLIVLPTSYSRPQDKTVHSTAK